MRNQRNGKEPLSPILIVLLTSSLSLAIVDKENRPVYFQIVNLVVIYSSEKEKIEDSDS
jgi:hypothetical protein